MQLATGTLRKIQLLEAFLLQQLKLICEEIGIEFWLHGGTLLGAVRHQGFIPWDDDIDLGMMRADIEKLKNYLKENRTPFKLDYFYFTEYYYSRQARFVYADFDIPLCLDIFVYDNADSASQELWKWHGTLRKNLKKEIIDSKIHCNSKHHIETLEERAILDNIIQKYIDQFANNRSDKALIFGIEHGASRFQRLFDASFIRPFKTLKFENNFYNVPNCYEEYLENQYGNYLEFPKNFGTQKHTYNYTKDDYQNYNKKFIKYL